MKMNNPPNLLLVLAVALMPLTVLGQKEITKTFNGIKSVKVSTASGSCVITRSATQAVTVKLEYTYNDEDYTPSIEQEGDQLVAKEKFHRNSVNGKADWTLTIPDNLAVHYVTGSGDVDVTGLAVDLKITTGSGDFMFHNITGEVDCTTGSGDVEIENANGSIEATSGSGSFRVARSKGSLKLTSGSGNLKLSDNTADFAATTGSGNIRATGLSPQGSSSFTSGSGTVEIELASTPAHDMSVTSGSGNAILNFNGNEIKGEIVMKVSKKHGSIQAPFEFDKTEEIKHSGNDVTIQKTAVKGSSTPRISISSGSGQAVLKK